MQGTLTVEQIKRLISYLPDINQMVHNHKHILPPAPSYRSIKPDSIYSFSFQLSRNDNGNMFYLFGEFFKFLSEAFTYSASEVLEVTEKKSTASTPASLIGWLKEKLTPSLQTTSFELTFEQSLPYPKDKFSAYPPRTGIPCIGVKLGEVSYVKEVLAALDKANPELKKANEPTQSGDYELSVLNSALLKAFQEKMSEYWLVKYQNFLQEKARQAMDLERRSPISGAKMIRFLSYFKAEDLEILQRIKSPEPLSELSAFALSLGKKLEVNPSWHEPYMNEKYTVDYPDLEAVLLQNLSSDAFQHVLQQKCWKPLGHDGKFGSHTDKFFALVQKGTRKKADLEGLDNTSLVVRQIVQKQGSKFANTPSSPIGSYI